MRKVFGVICLILAVGFFFGGIASITKPLPSGAAYSAGHYVGSFIPFLIALMLGLRMFKDKNSEDQES